MTQYTYIYRDVDGKKRVFNQKPEGITTPIFKWSNCDDSEILNSKWSIKHTGYNEFSLVDPFGEVRKASNLMGAWGEFSSSGHGLYFSVVEDFSSWSAWDEYEKNRKLQDEVKRLQKEVEDLKKASQEITEFKSKVLSALGILKSGKNIIFPINNIRQLRAVFGKAEL